MTQLKSVFLRAVAGFAVLSLAALTTSSVYPRNGDGRTLETFTYQNTATTTGKLRPNRDLTIKAKLSENVDEIVVPEGTRVEKGELLLRFDTATHRIRLDRTRHRLERARHQKEITRKNFERKQSLLDRDLVSQREFDQAELEFKQAQENLAIAESDLEDARRQFGYTSVESPFPGILDRHLVELGEQVRRGQGLLQLLQLDPLKVKFEVTPEERDHLSEGDSITVDLTGGTMPAEISHLSHDVSPENGLYSVTALLPNPEYQLVAGRTVDLTVPLNTIEDAVKIPLTHVDRSGEDPELLLRDPATATVHRRPLNIIDYEQEYVVTRLTWPASWRLLPGSVYTETDS